MRRAIRRALVPALVLAAMGCGTPAPEDPRSTPPVLAQGPAPAPLAEGPVSDSSLALEITAVTRGGPEVLEVAFTLVNRGAAAAVPPGAAGEGWLAGGYVVDEGRQKRFYVLRDREGRPRCSTATGELASGGRVSLTARFPAPGPEGGRLTVVVPGVPPFRAVPFPGTDSSGPS